MKFSQNCSIVISFNLKSASWNKFKTPCHLQGIAKTNWHTINSLWEFQTTFILGVVWLKARFWSKQWDQGYKVKLQIYETCKMKELEDKNDLIYQQLELFQKSQGKNSTL